VETESVEEKTKQRAVFLHYHTVIEPEVGYRFGWISSRTPNWKPEAVQGIQEMHLITGGTYRSAKRKERRINLTHGICLHDFFGIDKIVQLFMTYYGDRMVSWFITRPTTKKPEPSS